MTDEVTLENLRIAERAWGDIVTERVDQISRHGWDHAHDDAHTTGELARAAGVYAIVAGRPDIPPLHDVFVSQWPFEPAIYKPRGARRNLVRAGTLILAEIERLDRAGERERTARPVALPGSGR